MNLFRRSADSLYDCIEFIQRKVRKKPPSATNKIHLEDYPKSNDQEVANQQPPLPPKPLPYHEDSLSTRYESLNFERIYNRIAIEQTDDKETNPYLVARKHHIRWFVLFIIGLLTAIMAFIMDALISQISKWKNGLIIQKIDDCTSKGCLWEAFLLWFSTNIGFTLIAVLLVLFLSESSAGSGLPKVKCYLNGMKVPEIFRLKALFTTVVGASFAVIGGLASGKEGPMIHSGAMIGASIPQGLSKTLKFDAKVFKYFRYDLEKRDFITAGAAAGCAAAFSAPMGGLLFALEEGASFWSQSLTWDTLFATMITYFFLTLLRSFTHGIYGQLSNPDLVNFGKFYSFVYRWYELPIYALMGIIGGLVGALFNYVNIALSKFRRTHVNNSKMKRLVEACIVAGSYAIVNFVLSLALSYDCPTKSHASDLHEFQNPPKVYCSEGHYSAIARLFLQVPELEIKSLFHDFPGAFKPSTLGIFTVVYFLLAVWTYGIAVPSGVFMPAFVIGSSWGRLFGIGMNFLMPGVGIDMRRYALIGAASTLGGFYRMLISLTVIVLESTGDISMVLPILLAIFVAKQVGDLFNKGIFEMHIKLSGFPFLEHTPPAMTTKKNARDVMSRPVVVLNLKEKVGHILDILQNTKHNGFPVIEGGEATDTTFGRLRGFMLRHQLLTMLKKKVYLNKDKILDPDDFTEIYPHYYKLESFVSTIEENELACELDLEPYMNLAPHTLNEDSNFPKIYNTFRGLGLRHLTIVNNQNMVVGIITRIDIAKYHTHFGPCKAKLKQLKVTL